MLKPLRHPKTLDLRGRFFGRLTVLSQDLSKKYVFWLCACSCGNFCSIHSANLVHLGTKSCGCFKRDSNTKHGLFGTDELRIWKGIIDRCYNKERDPEAFARYGGRGIDVCPKWRDNPVQFYTDMGQRPNKKMTIERIDNNKGYSKENCKWATRKEQGRNRRNNKNVIYQNRQMTVAEFREDYCPWFTHESLRYRLKQGLTTEQIVQIPKHTRYTKLLAVKISE